MLAIIKHYMKSNNINQRKMSAILEIHESQLNRWLSGKNKMSKGCKILIQQKLDKKAKENEK